MGRPVSTRAKIDVPRAGMLATVRNRQGVVAAVEPFDGENGRLHLVHLDYKDSHTPSEERLLWELEPNRDLLEPNALPDPAQADAMRPEDFDALLRAARWTALSPYLGPDAESLQPGSAKGNPSQVDSARTRELIASPFHGSVRVEDYQLVPLLKALRMPRVSLLIADDVGLGKTVEAGLILTELLLRRRIQRILVLTPASLRQQWRDELWEKFSLRFEVVDRQATERLRRRLGMDANPWRSFSRIVASYHYLRQPDVREQFLAACHTPTGSPHLPWDLLIVDECHNLMPSPFGEDSELCQTLRLVAPRFEHRLFLSATPHNGHTRSFTGLLEMLDPVRFTRTSEMSPAMRQRVDDVVVRRLKREINAGAVSGSKALNPGARDSNRSQESAAAPRFCTRNAPTALALASDARETALAAAFDAFRTAIRKLVAAGTERRRRPGTFAVEILGKRLLSCPTAFAESWHRVSQGFADQAAPETELTAAERALRRETADDREMQQREATAAHVVGAWLKNFAGEVAPEIGRIERALNALGFDLNGAPITEQTPVADTRFDMLIDLIERLLRVDDDFRADERLIVFTEYKTTLDYLARRLRERYPAERVLTLFGAGGSSHARGFPSRSPAEGSGMTDADRENVKAVFNDPAAAVRILVATDAASEGLNLHRTARYLLHYDCPWNPSRLEQRNGRLDRYGQGRDVTVHHFVSDTDPDLRFLDHVIRKADEIREDLGSVNEIFDRAVHRRLIRGEDAATVQADLDANINTAKGSPLIDADTTLAPDSDETRGAFGRGVRAGAPRRIATRLDAMAEEIDLDPNALMQTLDTAMAIGAQGPQLHVAEEPGLYRVSNPGLPGWRDVIDDAVRRSTPDGALGPMPKLAFSPEPFIEQLGRLRVFLPRRDALLMHLAHPLLQRSLSILTRRRYPGDQQVSRWTVRLGGVPAHDDALILLSVEELAVNALRETFHRWVRTLAFPVQNGKLGQPLPHTPASAHRGARATIGANNRQRAGDLLEDINIHLRRWLREHASQLTESLRRQLRADEQNARRREDERYRQRQGELSALIEQSTVARLAREIEDLKNRRRQGELFDEDDRLTKIDQSIEQRKEEIERRRHHYEEIREQLQRERTRILDHLLPARYAMAGEAQVFPVAVEVRLRERAT